MTPDTPHHEEASMNPIAAPSPGSDAMLAFVVKCAAALCLLGVVASAVAEPDYPARPLSFGFGAMLAVINFWLSRRIVARMVSQRDGGGSTAGMMVAKMLGFFGLVYVAFKLLPIDELGFTGGLFVVVISILIGNAFGPKARVESQHG
jgi:hypothetical protein